jgi:hypothetical protein
MSNLSSVDSEPMLSRNVSSSGGFHELASVSSPPKIGPGFFAS